MLSALLLLLGQRLPLAPSGAALGAPVGARQERAPAARGATGVSRELEDVARELAAATFARSPWLAPERGFAPAEPLGLGAWSRADLRVWRDGLASLARRLESLPGEGLDPLARAERDGLRAAVELETLRRDLRPEERWSALAWVARVDRTLGVELEAGPGAGEVDALLAALPAYWDEARAVLLSPAEPGRQAALARLEALEPVLVSLASSADGSKATEATRRFHAWLAAPPAPSTPPESPLGALRWLRMLEAAAGPHGSVQELEASVLRDLAQLEREQHGLESLRAPSADPEPDSNEPSFEEIAAEACREAWTGRFASYVGESEVPRFALRASELPARSGRTALFLPSNGQGAALLVDPELFGARDPRTWRRAALRHGVPGEALVSWSSARAERAAARWLPNRAFVEGWGCLALAELGRDPSPELAARAAGEVELEALRLLATLDVQALGLSPAAAAARFERRSGLPVERALDEVQRSLDDPLRGVGFLGFRDLTRLKSALAGQPGAFFELALSHPDLRPADLAGAGR